MERNNDKNADQLIEMCDASLIEEIKLAVDAEKLPVRFTTADIVVWMKNENIVKPDGSPYDRISRELLENYSLHTPITKKRKRKVLYTSPNGKMFSFNPFKGWGTLLFKKTQK